MFWVPGCSVSLRCTVCVGLGDCPVSHLTPTPRPELLSRSSARVDRQVLLAKSMPGDASGQGDLSHFGDASTSVMCSVQATARFHPGELQGAAPAADTSASKRSGRSSRASSVNMPFLLTSTQSWRRVLSVPRPPPSVRLAWVLLAEALPTRCPPGRPRGRPHL